MFLVDSKIKELCEHNSLIVENYKPENIGAISYDLRIESVIVNNEGASTEYNGYELYPQQTVFVSTMETIKIPNNFIGIVTEKNSVMRQGLMVAAPYYQPGHHTKCFLRVTNISSDIISISNGKEIAQIMFYKLETSPDKPYSAIPNASFNDEISYKGLGNYTSLYKKELKKLEKAEENLDDKIDTIYSNVLAYMSIIAAVFSLVTLNFEAFGNKDFTVENVLSLNLSMAFVISILMGIILFFINKKAKKWWVYLIYLLFVISLLALNIMIMVT